MARPRQFAGLAVAAFVVFLVGNAPATLLSSFAPNQLELVGAQGSLWSGQAQAVRIGDVQTGITRWNLSPWQLLVGRVAGTVDAELPGGFARGGFAIGFGGSLGLQDFSLASPLASLSQATGMGLPVQDGEVVAELAALDVRDGWPERAVGQVRVAGIALVFRNGQPVQDQLASFELTFDADEVPDSGLIEGTLEDRGGPLEVVGRLQVTPPGNYEMSGRAAPREDAPREMEQALIMLGPPNPDGGRDFSFAGSL